MKRTLLPVLLSLVVIISITPASFAEGNRSITILYTGSVRGAVDPLVGCACGKSGSSGGLARRAQMIESIRKDKGSVLLLDGGAVFDSRKENAELQLKAMERMGYDAMNLGSPEFHFGKEFLERTHASVSFPYIASNLLYRGSRLPWTREYVIKEVGGLKVAILGILDPDDLKNIQRQGDAKGFEVLRPETILNRLLPEVRGKADLVILLSQLDEVKNRALVEAAKGIDVAVSPGDDDDKKPENTVVILNTGSRGMTMGLLTITFDEKRALSVSERRHVQLDPSVPNNRAMAELIDTYEKEQEMKKLEVLKLSPQEFIERYRKEQVGKGGAQ